MANVAPPLEAGDEPNLATCSTSAPAPVIPTQIPTRHPHSPLVLVLTSDHTGS
ncbi:hypothetical protein [Actinopolymorpha alba]|uniref:hypothetical protein n=1 Tax=Actinopolymorpha alba TaxID=533267 RepID=UPI0012F70323|nr:hypothetical protein [Actinopolymorpha alba]